MKRKSGLGKVYIYVAVFFFFWSKEKFYDFKIFQYPEGWAQTWKGQRFFLNNLAIDCQETFKVSTHHLRTVVELPTHVLKSFFFIHHVEIHSKFSSKWWRSFPLKPRWKKIWFSDSSNCWCPWKESRCRGMKSRVIIIIPYYIFVFSSFFYASASYLNFSLHSSSCFS